MITSFARKLFQKPQALLIFSNFAECQWESNSIKLMYAEIFIEIEKKIWVKHSKVNARNY